MCVGTGWLRICTGWLCVGTGWCGFDLVSCAGFALQPHSTSLQQTLAKFLNAEKMAKCLGLGGFIHRVREQLSLPPLARVEGLCGGQVERTLYRGPDI